MKVLIGFDGSGLKAAVEDLILAGLPADAEALVLSVADMLVRVPYEDYHPVNDAKGPPGRKARADARCARRRGDARGAGGRARGRWHGRVAVSRLEGQFRGRRRLLSIGRWSRRATSRARTWLSWGHRGGWRSVTFYSAACRRTCWGMHVAAFRVGRTRQGARRPSRRGRSVVPSSARRAWCLCMLQPVGCWPNTSPAVSAIGKDERFPPIYSSPVWEIVWTAETFIGHSMRCLGRSGCEVQPPVGALVCTTCARMPSPRKCRVAP